MKMEQSNVFQLFEGFSQYDWTGLNKFLHSPYHNQREDVTQLFHFFKAYFQSDTHHTLDVTEVQKFIGQTADQPIQNLRYTMSFLFQLTKEFLLLKAQKALDKQEKTVGNDDLWLKELRARNKTDLLQKELGKITRAADQNYFKNERILLKQYQVSMERHAIAQLTNRNSTEHLEHASADIENIFFLEKLRLYAHSLVHQSMTDTDISDMFIVQIMSAVKEDPRAYLPQIQVYFYACLAFENFKKEGNYFLFKAVLLGNDDQLTEVQNKECYLLAINYCIRKLNGGARSFVQEVFDLYRAGLERNAFSENGYLSRFSYKNINTAALGMGKFAWAEEFLNAYRDQLDPQFREDAYRYNLSILKYKQGDFDGTLEILRFVDFEDLFFNLNARTMLLKIFYEKELWNAFESHLDSFKVFLYRHSELGYQKKHYLNLVKNAKRLLKVFTYNRQRKIRFYEKLQAETELAEKQWLIAKLKVFL